MGLPLPRSARVKVEYDLVQKDPKITEQLRQIVHFKDVKGKQVLNEGRKESLISERTFSVNVRRLEKWVNASYRKIQELDQGRARTKPKLQTNTQLIQESVEGRDRLHKLMTGNIDGESSRQQSHLSQSWRAPGPKQTESNSYYHSYRQSNKGDTYTDRDPYRDNHQSSKNNYQAALGSGRQQQSKLIELIQGETSRTSSKPKQGHSSSESQRQKQRSHSRENQRDDPLQQEGSQNEELSLKLEDI